MTKHFIFSLALLLPLFAQAQFDESLFKQALKVKKNAYLSQGAFTGGDRAQSNFRITSVRLASNPEGFDRIVIDSASTRAPFFLVDVDGPSKKINVTVYGSPKLEFSSQSAIQAAKKTKLVSKLNFIPLVNSDRWTWSIQSSVAVRAEVFELTEPARIIIDLKK